MNCGASRLALVIFRKGGLGVMQDGTDLCRNIINVWVKVSCFETSAIPCRLQTVLFVFAQEGCPTDSVLEKET